MLENIKSILQNYAEVKDYLDEAITQENKRLNNLIRSRELTHNEADEDLQIFKDRANKRLSDIKNQSINAVNYAFDIIKSTIDEHAKTPIPEGFYDTLNALEQVKDNLTKEEFELYTEKYINNSLASKALYSRFPKMFEDKPVSYDELLESHEVTYNEIIEWFKHYNKLNYRSRLLLSDTSVLDSYSEILASFLNKTNLVLDLPQVETKDDIDIKTKDFVKVHIEKKPLYL